jgi:hypothetical protein
MSILSFCKDGDKRAEIFLFVIQIRKGPQGEAELEVSANLGRGDIPDKNFQIFRYSKQRQCDLRLVR